jgi:hypothetical protein
MRFKGDVISRFTAISRRFYANKTLLVDVSCE